LWFIFVKQLIIRINGKPWSSCKCCLFNETSMMVPFAFIIIIIFEYISWLLILLSNALQTPSPNTGFTRRLYSVHAARLQRAHGALEDPTALPQPPYSALFNTLCKRQTAAFVLSMFKINAAAWRSRRFHSSISTGLLVNAHRALRRSATLLNTVETLWGSRSGVAGL